MNDTITSREVSAWLRAFAAAVAQRRDELTQLDAAIGDADHGVNMDRGMQAVVAKLDGAPDDDVGALLKLAGMTLVSTVGGAAGPLYGTLFLEMGKAAGPAPALTRGGVGERAGGRRQRGPGAGEGGTR